MKIVDTFKIGVLKEDSFLSKKECKDIITKIDSYKFMTNCVMTKKLGSQNLAAAIHPYDMTCRPHILSKNENKDYEKLIYEFGKLSGVYALLNTSFNLHGYPIINTLGDAINILKKSNLDGLLLKECLIIKDEI